MNLYVLSELTRYAAIAAAVSGGVSLVLYLLTVASTKFSVIRKSAAWAFLWSACVLAARSIYLGVEWVVLDEPGAAVEFLYLLSMGLGLLLIGALPLVVEHARKRFTKKHA